MKYLIAFLLALPTILSAQEEYKAEVGDNTLELQLAPLSSSPIGLNGIRYRKFLDNGLAFRMNAFVSFQSSSDVTGQADADNDIPELRDTYSQFSFNLRPGFENHLAGTDRLSPYFGLEVDLALQTSTNTEEFTNGNNDIYSETLSNSAGFLRLGVNGLAGLDYYVTKKLYLGTELGFGFSYTNFLDVQLTSDEAGFTEPDPLKRGGSFNIGPNVNAQIRLGYAF